MKRTVIAASLAGALLSSVLATPAAAQNNKPKNKSATVELLTETDMSWELGSSEWVNLMWTSDTQIDDVQVRLTGLSKGVEVEYPSEASFSRLGVDPVLSPSEIDFSAVRITTSDPGEKFATAEISWSDGDGGRDSAAFDLRLSNKKYQGEDFAILTESAVATTDVEAGHQNWIDLDYKGLAPTSRSMAMRVSGDLPVYHPQETFTSLHHDEVLHAGESDVARVWFDPELITAGDYTLVVEIDYVDSDGRPQTTSHELLLTVV